tara:strand:- start:28112 stop:28687 length:576 start_codon:yes stop_codon:yes gene_type:complete
MWPDHHTVTAIEYDQKIADIYQDQNPRDEVIVSTDAHQYLLENCQDFDFVWSSPPCQSHSRMIRSGKNRKPRFPDMRLYEEIIFLKYSAPDVLWVVENVVPYYKPLIEPSTKVGRHLFWSNFEITAEDVKRPAGFINLDNRAGAEKLKNWLGIDYDGYVYYDGNHCPAQILRNAVHPKIGLHILNDAQKGQ